MLIKRLVVATALLASVGAVLAHGDVTPQVVDVSTLRPLGDGILDSNPYVGDKEAIRVGSSAYNQNCARCHGLEAISGGVSPDLRKLNDECATVNANKKKQCQVELDSYYRNSVLGGKVRDGRVYMPAFAGILSQEAIWAIKSYIETRKYE
ncbi:MAG: cytochrome c-550 PedF [Limnobacter sp.]|uniref:cytochrome c-550 PedF n=1 Tax=Limnobacter sp. TaxID=2003368 RepID=UPI00391BA872